MTDAHSLPSGALAIGVVAGITAAVASAAAYLMSRHHTSLGGSSHRLLLMGHTLMGVACLPLSFMLWPEGLPLKAAWVAPLFGSSLSYLVGQGVLFAALARSDASRVAPLLGLKIAMLAGIVSCTPGESLDLRQWLAVALSVVAAVMLQRRGGMNRSALGFTLVACVAFATSDLFIVRLIDGLQATAADSIGSLTRMRAGTVAMIITYALCGVFTAAILLVRPELRPTRRLTWTTGGLYAVTWLIGMAGLYTCFGLVGVVFGNILQSTRGMVAIVLGAMLAHAGWDEVETKVDRGTLALRLAAAALMTVAIAIYVIDVA